MQIHAEHNDTMIMTTRQWRRATTSLKNIPLTLFERLVCERELETEQNCNILISPSPPDIAMCRSRSHGLLNRGPGAPASLGHVLIPASSHHLVSKLTDFLSSPNYIIVQSPTQYLWNGMFDRHKAEITVMQFTGHSLPVYQFMTVAWDFTLFHFVSQARLRDFFT